jgi:glycosyltransferase involved in cell wall biosynthesis
MKIGIDCRIYSTTYGIGRYTSELIRHLLQVDAKNHYVLFFNNPEYDFFQCPNANWSKVLVNAPQYSIAEQTKFLNILNSLNLDLVHFTHFNVPIRYKKPYLVTIHDLTLHYYPDKHYTRRHRSLKKWSQIAAYRYTINNAAKKAKHIIAVTNNTKSDIQKELNINPDKISVIYEGVGGEFQPPSNVGQDRDPGLRLGSNPPSSILPTPYLLYTGNWRVHKNILNLIKAFKTVHEQKSSIKLVITGRQEPDYPEIPALIKKLGLRDAIITPGIVSESKLIELYQNATLYVFPSRYEGFGLPALEAMACHIPVVASKASCIPEVCNDAALYFDPEYPAEMAAAMLTVLNSQSIANNLTQQGIRNLKRFSWSKMAEETLQIYKEAV